MPKITFLQRKERNTDYLAWSLIKKYQLKTLNYALRKPTKTDKNRQKTDKKYRQKADKTDKMSVLNFRNSEKPTNVGS